MFENGKEIGPLNVTEVLMLAKSDQFVLAGHGSEQENQCTAAQHLVQAGAHASTLLLLNSSMETFGFCNTFSHISMVP